MAFSLKDDVLLVLDIITGIDLIALVLVARGSTTPYILFTLVGIGTLTHGDRDWEYLAGTANTFCANLPLFPVNNLKIAGLLAVAAWA